MSAARIQRPVGDAALRHEATTLARYIVGADPTPAMADRYGRACHRLGLDDSPAGEQRMVQFAIGHPWLLGPIDAAAGTLRPGCLLRRKCVLMAAILEATPEGAEWFLPRLRSRSTMVGVVIRAILLHVAQLAIGVPLFWFLARRQ